MLHSGVVYVLVKEWLEEGGVADGLFEDCFYV